MTRRKIYQILNRKNKLLVLSEEEYRKKFKTLQTIRPALGYELRVVKKGGGIR